jgi:NADH:ubiquinone oxidoreductase subunit 6 (subunit J)
MPVSPLAYSATYLVSVVGGYLITVVGAVLALATGVWYMLTGDYAGKAQRPMIFRALGALSALIFIFGIAWQLVGYLRLEYSNFFQP